MSYFKTNIVVPSIADELFLTIDDGKQTIEYSKVVRPSAGTLAACSDSQVWRVLPYRDETQFNNGEAIGGLGFQLVNFATRCHIDPDRIILTHDCAMAGVSENNGDDWYRLGGSTKSRGFYIDRPQAIIPSVANDDRLVAFGACYYNTNTQFVSFLPGFYLSTDGGSTWNQTEAWSWIMQEQTYQDWTTFGYARSQENVLVNDPANTDYWYCGTEYANPPYQIDAIDSQYRRIFRSTDNGSSWHNQQLLDTQLTGGTFDWWHALVVHPTNGSLFACTDKGLFVSTNAKTASDGDITFSRIEVDATRGQNLEIAHIVFDPTDSTVAYLAARDYKTDISNPSYGGTSYGSEYFAIYKSTDSGSTWSEFVSCWRTATSSNLAQSYIEASTFGSDVDSSTLFSAWNLAITPDGEDLYVIGGPNTWSWGVWLFKGIKDAGFLTSISSDTSSSYKTNLPGNARQFVLPGPTALRKYETVSACSGVGAPFKALTSSELTAGGYSANQIGYIFAESKNGWKGENIYSWHRAAHNPDVMLFGNADVNIYASLNGNDFVLNRSASSPATRGGVNHANSMLYATPSSGRVVAALGGPSNAHLAYYDSFDEEDWSATLAFFPGMRQSDIPADRLAEYNSSFPNEGTYGDRLYSRMLRNPDDINQIISADSLSTDGGLNWNYIPGLEKGTAGISDGGLSAEVIGVNWQTSGEHVVWAVNSTTPGARSCLLRATWSKTVGWSSWEKMPNIFGVVESVNEGSDTPTSSRMDLATISDLVVCVHPKNPDIVYAAACEGAFTVTRTTGHLWKFDYANRADTSSAFGSGLGGWTRIDSAKTAAQNVSLPNVKPHADNASGEVYLWISQILVDSNSAFSEDILYVVFGIPGGVAVLRSVDGGLTWSDFSATIPCSSTIRAFLEPTTGELITSACDGCYVHPPPTGYIRDSSIESLWASSAAIPVDI